MPTKTSHFSMPRWDETPSDDWSGAKLTRTIATKEFTGEIEGSGFLEAIMLRMQGDAGVMAYVGVERISCTLEGRTGTFALLHSAEAIGTERKAAWRILPGSGTGELVGISGQASITPDHDFTLTYEFASESK